MRRSDVQPAAEPRTPRGQQALLRACLALLLGGCERQSPAPDPVADVAGTDAERQQTAECEVISALVLHEFRRGTGFVADATAHYGWRHSDARSILRWDKLSPCGRATTNIMRDAAADCVNGDWYVSPLGWHGMPESLVVDLELWSQAVVVGRDVGPVTCLFADPAPVAALKRERHLPGAQLTSTTGSGSSCSVPQADPAWCARTASLTRVVDS